MRSSFFVVVWGGFGGLGFSFYLIFFVVVVLLWWWVWVFFFFWFCLVFLFRLFSFVSSLLVLDFWSTCQTIALLGCFRAYLQKQYLPSQCNFLTWDY